VITVPSITFCPGAVAEIKQQRFAQKRPRHQATQNWQLGIGHGKFFPTISQQPRYFVTIPPLERASMGTARTTPFEELTKLASDFVTAQRGMWDHAAWMHFLSHVEREGVEISEDMQSKVGDLLEAVKEYYAAVSSTEDGEKAMSTVFNEIVAFIKRQKGVWGHAEWEDFVRTIQQIMRNTSVGAIS
jgi:hypothetical protein